jgi:ketopantoate reductase
MLYGHSLGKLQARPPLTYMVPSNWRVIQLASLNGEIEVIEGDDHYITDGFDVEAVGRPPIESIFERPSRKHLSFNTLTLPAKTKFDIKTEPQPQDSYLPFRGFSQHVYGAPITFNNDPSELGYGSDGKLVVESRPHKRKISTDDLLLLKNEEAEKKLGPIKNLVCAVDAQVVVHALQSLKHRLNRDSTILFTQKGMGIMEMVNEQVFPDPKTRPTYIPGIFSHAVWQSDNHATSPDFAHERESGSSGLEASVPLNKLSVKHGIFGSLILGPVAPVEGEKVMQRVCRQRSANYFVSALLAAPSLRARCLPANLLLRIRLRDLAVSSVVGPSTVRFQCNNGGLLANEERIAHLQSRLREAARIVQTFDSSLTYEYLERGLGDYLVKTGDRVNIMFKNVLAGRKTDIEVYPFDSPSNQSLFLLCV